MVLIQWLLNLLWPKKPEPVVPRPVPLGKAELIAEINKVRVENGKAPFVENLALTAFAQSWAELNARSRWNPMSHGNFANRFNAAFPNRAGAENLFPTNATPQLVVAGWMNDPPHYRNLMGDYNLIGVGVDTDGRINYWCVDFMKV